MDANLEVLRSQRHEIDADVAHGILPADAREDALAQLVGRARDDLVPVAAASSHEGKAWWPAAIAAVAIPALAFGLYAYTGNPAASDTKARVAANAPPDNHQINEMVEKLARKVKERPDDAQGWALLARSMAALQRFKESADAYAQLVKLAPGDAQVLADYADALGMAQGRSLAGLPEQLALQALKIDPKHRKSLALAGTAALDRNDFTAARSYWQRLAAELQPGSDDEKQVQAILAEVDARASGQGLALAPAPAKPGAPAIAPAKPAAAPSAPAAAPRTAQAPGATGSSVTGSVSLASALSGKLSGTETLFIFARSDGGPRVPLAVIRATARELPMKFTLDDSQAMAPGMNLSSAQAVRIEARISRSGNATPQPGDLVGASAVIKPGTRDVNIVIDKALP